MEMREACHGIEIQATSFVWIGSYKERASSADDRALKPEAASREAFCHRSYLKFCKVVHVINKSKDR